MSNPSALAEVSGADQPTKRRTRNACDACRARRIKCYYCGPICRACLASEIPCTQERPRKKRGPVNRYVEAQHRKAQEEHLASPSPIQESNLPPTFADTYARSVPDSGPSNNLVYHSPLNDTLPINTPDPGTSSLDDIAPVAIISHVVHDWFEWVHPVCPILHRDTFLRQLADRTAYSLGFINLVLSLCAATVSTLRLRGAAYSGMITVEKCYEAIRQNERVEARVKPPIDLVWCQTKYNLSNSLASDRGIDDPTPQLLLAEAVAGTTYLLYYHHDHMQRMDQELLKRLYWLCFAGQCTYGLHRRPHLGMLNMQANLDRTKPLDITDTDLATITPGEEQWHGNITMYTPGLNALSNLFILWAKSQQGDCDDLVHVQHYLKLVLCSLDDIPPVLRWRGGLSRPSGSNFGTDVQMVNLYITQIHIRSFLLDQMDRAADKAGDNATVVWIANARQSLVDDMLAIIYQMPEDTLEANGHSLIPKMRDIGLALLNDTRNPAKALSKLDRLLQKLEKLDIPRAQHFESISPTSL